MYAWALEVIKHLFYNTVCTRQCVRLESSLMSLFTRVITSDSTPSKILIHLPAHTQAHTHFECNKISLDVSMYQCHTGIICSL